METKKFKFWVEIEGKMKGKRKVTRESMLVNLCPITEHAPVADSFAARERVAELVATFKPQRGTVWRFMRTVVTECNYGDGMVMHMIPIFDVNRKIIDSGDVKIK